MTAQKRLRPYLLSLGFVLLCAFPLFKMEYSTDTYHFALWDGLSGISSAMDYNGRFLISYVARACDAMGMSFNGFYYFSFIMAIIFASLSITTLFGMLKGHMQEHLALLLSVVTIFNPMIMELFLFIEKGFFLFAIYMSILAAKAFVLFLTGKRYFIVFSFLLLPFAAFTYQALPNTFVTLVLVFIIIYSRTVKAFILNTSLAILVYGFSTFLNYLVMRLTNETARMGSGFSLANIYKYFTFNLSSPYMLLIWVGIFGVLGACVFGSSKKKTGKAFTKQSALTFFNYSYLILGAFLGACAPGAFSRSDQAWLMLRTAYPLGMLLGAIPILYHYKESYTENGKECLLHRSNRALLIATACTLLSITVYLHMFFFSRLITNERDFDEAYKIGQAIDEYEEQTGNKVYNVAIYYDKSMKDYYDGVVKFSDCNVRALSRPWSDVKHLELILDKRLVKVDPNPEYAAHFSVRQWHSQSPEQFIFEGNTLHLCVY